MAWLKGELITASKLNSEHVGVASTVSINNPASSGGSTTPWCFCHNRTGRVVYLHTRGTSYWWAKSDGVFWFRNSSGNVYEHRIWWEAGSTSKTHEHTVYVQNYPYGVGWYQARVWTNRGWGSASVYWAQDDCKRGEKLVYWDSPTSSGNKIPGTLITAEILNSHRVGTI